MIGDILMRVAYIRRNVDDFDPEIAIETAVEDVDRGVSEEEIETATEVVGTWETEQ